MNGGEHAGVEAARGVAEEVDGDVEAAPDPYARAGDLVAEGGRAERRQVDVVDRVGVDLPALADHQADLRHRQLAVEEVADGEIEDTRPVAVSPPAAAGSGGLAGAR